MPWPDDVLINVNFPDLLAEEVAGMQVTTQGNRKIGDTLVEASTRAASPISGCGACARTTDQEGTDLAAVAGVDLGHPVHLDMTHRPTLEPLRACSAGRPRLRPARRGLRVARRLR